MAATRTSRRDWSRGVEAASLASRDAAPAAAARRFDRDLTAAEQMQLVRELVETRAAELTLAFRNVVMVLAGHKKRSRRDGSEQLSRKPCVVLVVRDKWDRTRDAAAGEQLIPRRLLAYAQVAGRHVLCAVPTDVQHERSFYGASPQAGRAIYPDDSADKFGTLTCAVKVGQRRMLLSCRHVLSPLPEIGGGIASGTRFVQFGTPGQPPAGPEVGTSAAIGGALRERDEISFDAQLAAIAPGAGPLLKALLADMPLSPGEPFVESPERFDQVVAERPFEILVPDNNPKAHSRLRPTHAARFETMLRRAFHFDYQVRVGGLPRACSVSHWELLKFKLLDGRTTLPGDSGSPVVVWNADGSCTLVAMHIAGIHGQSYSFAIPSWQLFAASNYIGLSAGTRMAPVDA